jgi:hypothetical protein
MSISGISAYQSQNILANYGVQPVNTARTPAQQSKIAAIRGDTASLSQEALARMNAMKTGNVASAVQSQNHPFGGLEASGPPHSLSTPTGNPARDKWVEWITSPEGNKEFLETMLAEVENGSRTVGLGLGSNGVVHGVAIMPPDFRGTGVGASWDKFKAVLEEFGIDHTDSNSLKRLVLDREFSDEVNRVFWERI